MFRYSNKPVSFSFLLQACFLLTMFNSDYSKLHHYIRQMTTTTRYQHQEGDMNMVVSRLMSSLTTKSFFRN